jgi:hypothetical protein
LTLFFAFSRFILASFYVKNASIASFSSSLIVMGLEGRSGGLGIIDVCGEGFEGSVRDREIGGNGGNGENGGSEGGGGG